MKTMLIPINGHLEVEPVKYEKFIASTQVSYEEKGKVLAIAPDSQCETEIRVGDIVYFDAWQVARYPDSEGKERYLVKEEDVRAIERG